MLIKKIINVGIIVSLTVAGVNLYRYLQERDDGKGAPCRRATLIC